jgi:hypothetical protein
MSTLLQINTALSNAQVTRVAAEQRWRALSSGNLMGAPEVLTNQSISTLLTARATAQAIWNGACAPPRRVSHGTGGQGADRCDQPADQRHRPKHPRLGQGAV